MRVSGCKGLLGLACMFVVLCMAGCGGGGGGGSDPTPQAINNAPTISRVTPSQGSVALDVSSSATMDFTIKAEDEDGGNLTCIWTWDAGYAEPEQSTVAAGANATTKFTPPNYNDTCTLRATVTDGQASASVTWQIQVTGNSTGPSGKLRIVSINVDPDPAQPSAAAGVTASVDNPGGKALTYTWKTKYGSISGSGASVSWNTPSSPGAYGIYLDVSDGTDEASAGVAVTVAGPSGGLLGEYYKTAREKNIVHLDELRLTRVDPNINFIWEKLSPAPGVLGTEGWGARWTGFIKCEQAGDYTFRVHVDDGARMKIQNDAGEWVWVIPPDDADWSDHTQGAWLPDPTEPLHLDGGKWYPVQLEFFQGAADAFITLYWSINGGAESIIPQEDLKPPS